MFEPLFNKISEDASVETVIEHIEKGPAVTTKTAAPIELIRAATEKLAFESLYELEPPTTEELVYQMKLASLEDIELFKTAEALARSGDEIFSVYESLGGKYKHAFGAPMFSGQQMAGSPAVSGGMASRASTPMPMAQQAQPVKSPATASPRAQASGMTNSPAGSAQTSAPSVTPAVAPAPSVPQG